MKNLPFIWLLLLLASCHTPERSLLSGYLNTSNLPAQSFIIHPDKDTFLISTGGVRIHIAKGSFDTDKQVTIEWKEALDFTSMLRAGLLTKNGKNILRSGGMFYFNTKENLDIKTPIKIDVPTQTVASGMQLYKGDSADGKMDWEDPKPIESIKAFGDNVLGKALFKNNCTQCHGVEKSGTGPALVGLQYRGPWKDRQQLYAWTSNPAGFMATNKYTQDLKCKYGVMMQAFPALSKEAMDSVYNFLDNETERLGMTGEPGLTAYDSCVIYQALYDSLSAKRSETNITNNNEITVIYNLPTKEPPPNTINPDEQQTDYYKVTIDATGWYNVDMLVKDWNGAKESKLIVKLQGANSDKQEVYLAIPSLKILTQGGYLGNGEEMGFDVVDGTIFLPQQTQAYLFAIGEQKGNFFYSRKDFITSTNQTIFLTAKEISKAQFDVEMQQLQKDGLQPKTDTTIQFGNLKNIDNQLETLRKKQLRDCGCTQWPPDNTSKDTTSAIYN